MVPLNLLLDGATGEVTNQILVNKGFRKMYSIVLYLTQMTKSMQVPTLLRDGGRGAKLFV